MTYSAVELSKKPANSNPVWLTEAIEALKIAGFCVIENVLSAELIEQTRKRMYQVQEKIHAEVGKDRLKLAGELGVLRLMMKYDSHLFKFLEIPQMLALVDAIVSPTAIMHLQNGFILPPCETGEKPELFQTKIHMDFPRVLNQYVVSLNIMVCIDEFAEENGGTLVVPGSHQKVHHPELNYLQKAATPVCCPAGSIFAFDSTLWHAAGANRSLEDRLAINHQFTRSYLKQQIDYCRALGEETILTLPPRSQQLLGYYTRTPSNLDEFYQPEDKRLYRRYQG